MTARRADQRRDLARIRSSASTARVINLANIADQSENSEDVRARPMFENRRLNQAIILKHAIRPHERELFKDPRRTATKIVLPFSGKDLHLGGMSFFVEEQNLTRNLDGLLGAGEDAKISARDREMLQHLASLPSFDPFLLKERTRRSGIDIATCYFNVSDADLMRMESFVSNEIKRLVTLALGGHEASNDASARLAHKLLHEPDGPELAPLRETLRLSIEEQKDGFFAWKGFLYYKWKLEQLHEPIATLKSGVMRIRCLDANRSEMSEVRASGERVMRALEAAVMRAQLAIGVYDRAFHDLITRGDTQKFRQFLLRAPTMFLQIGELMGAVTHTLSLWEYEFPDARAPTRPVMEALDILDEIERTLESASEVI